MARRIFIGNAFSLQMLDLTRSHEIETYTLSVSGVKAFWKDKCQVESCIGHVDTAAVVSSILEVEIPAQRINVKLEEDDLLIVAQLTGGRLPEGSTTLPEGFDIKFVVVKIKS